MTAGGFNNTGWHWTRKGWKRKPKRLQSVKIPKGPTKRRAFKKTVIKPADREKLPTFAEARKLAAEQGRAVSATTLAPEAENPATPPNAGDVGREICRADLTKPPKGKP